MHPAYVSTAFHGPAGSIPVPTTARVNDVATYLDRQPLFIVSMTPVHVNDRDMIVEERSNEQHGDDHYNIYVPAAAGAPRETASARFYYLKIGPGRYLTVSLEKDMSGNEGNADCGGRIADCCGVGIADWGVLVIIADCRLSTVDGRPDGW
jgi:hypothetical protein